jgi:hypothetical protein
VTLYADVGCAAWAARAAGALVGWAASPSGSAVDPVCENQAGWKDPVSADGTGCEGWNGYDCAETYEGFSPAVDVLVRGAGSHTSWLWKSFAQIVASAAPERTL